MWLRTNSMRNQVSKMMLSCIRTSSEPHIHERAFYEWMPQLSQPLSDIEMQLYSKPANYNSASTISSQRPPQTRLYESRRLYHNHVPKISFSKFSKTPVEKQQKPSPVIQPIIIPLPPISLPKAAKDTVCLRGKPTQSQAISH